ncbi:alpha/beta hydrolase fold domain-containing protein [Candidatus Poribacteria bacterium]|nr:alpha/beta hydrolase fold domain-containing protein [Candidatus Poribacteria bacterium]
MFSPPHYPNMNRKQSIHLQSLILGLTLLLANGCSARSSPGASIAQAASGPGGMEYRHAQVAKHLYNEGTDQEFWIFEPASPTPASAPVVIFNHGWSGVNPAIYGAWIKHLVRRGNIVVYPRYQENLRTSMKDFTPNAIAAVKAAILELQRGSHVRPQLDRVAVVGHSIGGALTPNIAALAASEGLPQPKALMSVEPGSSMLGHPNVNMPLADFQKIPPTTLMLVVVGADDEVVGDVDAKRIFQQTPQIPLENKDFIIFVSDSHGNPPLIANHFAPTARDDELDEDDKGGRRGRLSERIKEKAEQRGVGAVDALDYYGLWKLFDALMDAAFQGKNRTYALGNTPEQRYMGRWPDGTPVKELVVTDQP